MNRSRKCALYRDVLRALAPGQLCMLASEFFLLEPRCERLYRQHAPKHSAFSLAFFECCFESRKDPKEKVTERLPSSPLLFSRMPHQKSQEMRTFE
jgi:hypothetical protein